MKPIPLPTNRPKRGTALPAKLKPTFPTSHLITTLILLNKPPTDSIRTALASFLHTLHVGLLLQDLLGRRCEGGGRSDSCVVLGAGFASVVGDGGVVETMCVTAGSAGEDGVV